MHRQTNLQFLPLGILISMGDNSHFISSLDLPRRDHLIAGHRLSDWVSKALGLDKSDVLSLDFSQLWGIKGSVWDSWSSARTLCPNEACLHYEARPFVWREVPRLMRSGYCLVNGAEHCLFLSNVGRKFNVVIIANFRKFRFKYGTNETLLLRVKWNLSASLLKAEVAMDSKFEMKITAGVLPRVWANLTI